MRQWTEAERTAIEKMRLQIYCSCLSGILANSEMMLRGQSAAEDALEQSEIGTKVYIRSLVDRGILLERVIK